MSPMKGGSQVRALLSGCLIIAFGACAPAAPSKPGPTPPAKPATIPQPNVDSVARDSAPPANTSPACHAADAVSAEMIRRIRSTMTSTDRRVIKSRDMMRLPKVDPSLIVLATDESFCRRARQAVDSVIYAANPRALAQFRPRPPSYVVRIGDYTAVMDYRLPLTPDDRKRGLNEVANGEDIFDPKWNYIAVMVFN